MKDGTTDMGTSPSPSVSRGVHVCPGRQRFPHSLKRARSFKKDLAEWGSKRSYTFITVKRNSPTSACLAPRGALAVCHR